MAITGGVQQTPPSESQMTGTVMNSAHPRTSAKTLLGGEFRLRLRLVVFLLVVAFVCLAISVKAGVMLFGAGCLLVIVALTIVGAAIAVTVDPAQGEIRRFRLGTLGLIVERYPLSAFQSVAFHFSRTTFQGRERSIGPAPTVGFTRHRRSIIGIRLDGPEGALPVTREITVMAGRHRAEELATWLGLPLLDETVAPTQWRTPGEIGVPLADRLAESPVIASLTPPSGPSVVRYSIQGDEIAVEFPTRGIAWLPWLVSVAFIGIGLLAMFRTSTPATRGTALLWMSLLFLAVVGIPATFGFLLLAPTRFRVVASPAGLRVTRFLILGQRTQRWNSEIVEELLIQDESLVVTTRRGRFLLKIVTPHRIPFSELPPAQQAAIAAGQQPFPPSPDARFILKLVQAGLRRNPAGNT